MKKHGNMCTYTPRPHYVFLNFELVRKNSCFSVQRTMFCEYVHWIPVFPLMAAIFLYPEYDFIAQKSRSIREDHNRPTVERRNNIFFQVVMGCCRSMVPVLAAWQGSRCICALYAG